MAEAIPQQSPPISSINNQFITSAINLIRSGAQVMLVPSKDEKSLQELFAEVVKRINTEAQANGKPKSEAMEVVLWDCVYGFMKAGTAEIINVPNSTNLKTALSALISNDAKQFPVKNAVVVMFDTQNHLNSVLNSAERRVLAMGARNNMFVRVQQVAGKTTNVRRPVFLVQPDNRIHTDISDCVNLLRYDLPGPDELGTVLNNVAQGVDPSIVNLSEQDRYDISHALKGLTITRANDVLSLAVVKHRQVSSALLPTIQDLKSDMIAMSNRALTFMPYQQLAKYNDVIGYDDLLDYVDTRALAYSIEAAKFNLDYPKGMVISGLPGTGKTMAAIMLAKRLRLPLMKYNVGALYASAVGASEEMARDAHRIIGRTDGCVVFIDEADKMFNSITDGKNDGGVGQRVFSEILTWMSEKEDRNLAIMALNRFDGIPDELFRKGRFDEMFYVDLPSEDQRKQIIDIHLRSKGIDPTLYSKDGVADLLEATNNFVGAELKQVIIDARAHEFARTNRTSATPSVDLMVQIARRIAPFCQHETVGKKSDGFESVKKRSRPVYSKERPFLVKKKANA